MFLEFGSPILFIFIYLRLFKMDLTWRAVCAVRADGKCGEKRGARRKRGGRAAMGFPANGGRAGVTN